MGRNGRPTSSRKARRAARRPPPRVVARRVFAGSAGRGQGRRHRGQRAAEQVRPAYLPGVHPGGPRDRLDHHAFQRALVQFPRQQPGQEDCSAGVARANRIRQQPAPLRLGSGPDGCADLREHRVRPGQGERARGPASRPGRWPRAAGRRAPRSPPRSAAGAVRRRGTRPPPASLPAPPGAAAPAISSILTRRPDVSDTASDVRTKSLSSTYALCPRLPTRPQFRETLRPRAGHGPDLLSNAA